MYTRLMVKWGGGGGGRGEGDPLTSRYPANGEMREGWGTILTKLGYPANGEMGEGRGRGDPGGGR